MANLSRSQFAQAAHVSKAAVTKAVTAGRLLANSDGSLDTYNPLNAAFLAAHEQAHADEVVVLPGPGRRCKEIKPPPKSKRETRITEGPPPHSSEHKPAGDTVSPPDDLVGKALEAVNLKTEKDKADIALKRAQTRRHDLVLSEKKGELIPRELVRRKYAALDAALKTNMRDMPRRIAASITALALSGGRPAVEQALEAEISAALDRVLREARGQGLAE